MRLVLGAVALFACALVASPAGALPVLGNSGGCGGLAQPACPEPGSSAAAAPADCADSNGRSYIGTADQNPSDAIPMPRLGVPLIPRRADGRLPWGFNDLSFAMRGQDPKVGFTAAQDAAANGRAGTTVVRVPISWGGLERTRGEPLRWSHIDPLYCADARAGLGIVFTILGSPKWAVVGGTRCDTFCMSPPDSQYDGDLSSFARALAIRYPNAAAIEAWNEPNHTEFWDSPLPGGPGPDPARYTAVLKAIFTGVKSGNASMPVLGGDLGIGKSTSKDYELEDFLSGMYDNGAQRWMDGLSFHSYPVFPHSTGRSDRFHRTFSIVRSLVAARDYAGRRLWATEMGAAVAHVQTPPFTEQEQSSELLSYYRELNGADDVDAVMFHTLIDENQWGWLKPRDDQGRIYPRPVFCAFADRFARDVTNLRVPPARGTETGAPTKPKAHRKKHRHKRHRGRRKHHGTGSTRPHHHKRKAQKSDGQIDCSKPLSLPSA